MADAVVSFVLENLCRLLVHEANLLRGVEDNVRSLENELRMIKAFLERCHQNQRKNEIEHEVVRQITDVAHEAEDVIDTFAANVVKNRRRSWLSKMLHGVEHAKLRHHVANKIDNINARLNAIHKNRNKYHPQQEAAAGCSTDQGHERGREVEEDEVVGFEHDSTQVINLLKHGGSYRNVVSIIGMGGLGKTTVARKVYNSENVKNYFEFQAWVYVSKDYRSRELLIALLKCSMSISANSTSKRKHSKGIGEADFDDLYSLSEQELKDKVRQCLEKKRYLVVLDGLWNTRHWDELKYAFPNEQKSSRILITTRSIEVASHATSSYPYQHVLPCLDEEESWKLFSKRVFRGEGVPSHLEELGQEMVRSCHGLPISIVVLAGILTNKDKLGWEKIKRHVNYHLTKPETQVQDIVFEQSYDSLPARLRPCFLYFGMFPKDYEIPVRRLIQLWVAEGFIPPPSDHDTPAEHVAEDYLDELMCRSLIQVGRRRSDGVIKTCRIHDLLRNLCIHKSNEENVFEICKGGDTSKHTKPRRLSIQCKMSEFVDSSNKDHLGVRSILSFNQESYMFDSSKSKRLGEWFPLVRVLDLERPIFYQGKILTKLKKLVHLRYLRIEMVNDKVWEKCVKEIPKFICKLFWLETLDLGRSSKYIGLQKSITFPEGIWKLKTLRHLYTRGPVIFHDSEDVESKTMYLETLSCVAINKRSTFIVSLIGDGMFPKLTTLGLHFSEDDKHKKGVDQVWQNIRMLNSLKALKIFGFPRIQTSVEAFPKNLEELTIRCTKVNSDVMRTLGGLEELRILKLWDCLCEPELDCVKGFPKLESFRMKYMRPLRKWLLGKDVMPRLKSLVIGYCYSLEALPHELWSRTSLREVQVVWPSESLKTQLRRKPMRHGWNLIMNY